MEMLVLLNLVVLVVLLMLWRQHQLDQHLPGLPAVLQQQLQRTVAVQQW